MTESELEKLRSLLKSLSIHALIVGLLVLWFSLRPPTPKETELVAVEYPSPRQKRAQPQSAATGGGKKRGTRSYPSVSLDDLGVRIDYTPRTQQASSEREGALMEQDFTGGWDLMNPDPKIARFNQYVYKTVQRWLDNESMTNRLQLTGTVKVRIWFDGDGNYLESQTQYQAIDSDFQRIVARALRLAFNNPIPKPYLFTDKTFYIDREVYVRPY